MESQKIIEDDCDPRFGWKGYLRKRNRFLFRQTYGNSQEPLCKRHNLKIARCNYSRKIKDARKKGKNLIYFDKTWLIPIGYILKNGFLTTKNYCTLYLNGQGLILLHSVESRIRFLSEFKRLFKFFGRQMTETITQRCTQQC